MCTHTYTTTYTIVDASLTLHVPQLPRLLTQHQRISNPFRLHITNLLPRRHLPRHIPITAVTPAKRVLTLDRAAQLRGLVFAVEHEVVEVDLGAFEPFSRVDEPPDEDECLWGC